MMARYEVADSSRNHLFTFQADMLEASAPIMLCELDGSKPTSTPYQTADARHNIGDAASLLGDWLGTEFVEAGAEFIISKS